MFVEKCQLNIGIDKSREFSSVGSLDDCQFSKNKSAACCWLVGYLVCLLGELLSIRTPHEMLPAECVRLNLP
jgi:hypothetical protein